MGTQSVCDTERIVPELAAFAFQHPQRVECSLFLHKRAFSQRGRPLAASDRPSAKSVASPLLLRRQRRAARGAAFVSQVMAVLWRLGKRMVVEGREQIRYNLTLMVRRRLALVGVFLKKGVATMTDLFNRSTAEHPHCAVQVGKPAAARTAFGSITALTVLLLLAFTALNATVMADEPKETAKWPYAKDIRAFVEEIDRTYPFFELKGIRADWNRTKQRVLKEAETCKTDKVFAELLTQLLRTLRDAHLVPKNMKIELSGDRPAYYPGISFLPATNQRVIVLAALRGRELKPGTVVTRIDGQDARRFLEERAGAAWKRGGYFSSRQRARMFEFRMPLQGDKGETHRITVLADKEEKELKLTSDTSVRGWPHVYNMPEGLVRVGRSCFHAELRGGFGYLYLRRIDASIEDGITKAVEAHPDVKGWMIDLRGNGGGGYGRSLSDKLKTLRKPVACLIDAGCISAGETFARDIVRNCDGRLFGSTTAGSSSSKRSWQFPSGIGSMTLSTRSRFGIDGRLIEYNGIDPHVAVEAVPEEVQQGQNSCVLRALEYLVAEQGKPSQGR
jgi:C-terminal processing protease CtpA/Prc